MPAIRASELALLAQPHDSAFEMGSGLMRTPMRSTGTILEPASAFGEPAPPPFVGGLA
jgi:hypothetical protein